MKKICLCLMLLTCSFSIPSLSWEPDYRILTDDYGILTEKDLQKEAEFAAEPRLIIEKHSPFMVWQCLPLVDVSMECHLVGDDIAPGEPGADTLLKIFDGHSLYEFLPRRPRSLEVCEEIIEWWQYLFDGEEVACVSASYEDDDAVSGNDPWSRHSYWTINRIKSHKGSWSYFIENDDLDILGQSIP